MSGAGSALGIRLLDALESAVETGHAERRSGPDGSAEYFLTEAGQRLVREAAVQVALCRRCGNVHEGNCT